MSEEITYVLKASYLVPLAIFLLRYRGLDTVFRYIGLYIILGTAMETMQFIFPPKLVFSYGYNIYMLLEFLTISMVYHAAYGKSVCKLSNELGLPSFRYRSAIYFFCVVFLTFYYFRVNGDMGQWDSLAISFSFFIFIFYGVLYLGVYFDKLVQGMKGMTYKQMVKVGTGFSTVFNSPYAMAFFALTIYFAGMFWSMLLRPYFNDSDMVNIWVPLNAALNIFKNLTIAYAFHSTYKKAVLA